MLSTLFEHWCVLVKLKYIDYHKLEIEKCFTWSHPNAIKSNTHSCSPVNGLMTQDLKLEFFLIE